MNGSIGATCITHHHFKIPIADADAGNLIDLATVKAMGFSPYLRQR